MCECAAMRLSPRSSLLSEMVVMGYMGQQGLQATRGITYNGHDGVVWVQAECSCDLRQQQFANARKAPVAATAHGPPGPGLVGRRVNASAPANDPHRGFRSVQPRS